MRIVTLAPIDLAHPAVTVSTARAGGVGVLDAVHCRAERAALAAANLARCLAQVAPGGPPALGLRLTEAQVAAHPSWLAALAGRPHWILLDQWSPETVARTLAELVCDGREVWVDVGDGQQIPAVDPSWPFAGWAARGAECGGLAGTESAFVLAQRLARQPKPFLVRGGIGVHSAAACLAAGAHAVVLDDVLWLLRESPLPAEWRHVIARLGLTDTTRAGGALGLPVRVIDRPDAPAGRALIAAAGALEAAADTGAGRWRDEVMARVGWDDPDVAAWPVGEGIGRAAEYAARFVSVPRLVRAVADEARAHVAEAARLQPLAEGGPLAAACGTRYPIVQGPMTRVSDTAGFAAAVADAGALPLVALALMRAPEVERLLESTSAALGGRPWGVGILGFVPTDLRDEQLAIVDRVRPPFALISGGRPDQAAALEARGIATFLHAPAPLLLPFLQQGARRFVFEGGECGGHVGPLHSFALWDYAVEALARTVTDAEAPRVDAVFAGGIHDDLSAAMVAALAAPLAVRGVRVGVLMGTAYLFTDAAVASGAITPAFQRTAAASDHTVTITTGPGHVVRCAPTPFTSHFTSRRAALVGDGVSGEALSTALDALVVGRARVASKGLERIGDALVAVDAARQQDEGLYMLGEVAGLRRETTSVDALHDTVCAGGAAWLTRVAPPIVSAAAAAARPADVAIIGLACLVPGARDAAGFWRHVLDRHAAITEIPRERWDWRRYYDPHPGARDRIASRWGGFIEPIAFDPRRFGIPPRSLASITPPQLLALELSRRALLDAGFADARPEAAVRRRTSVVFGTGNTADLEQLYMTRAALPLILPEAGEDVLDRLPEWTEESYPGLLASVVAGRVANRFDFGGANLTVDAACASSLAALDVAVRDLAEGRADLALAGGIEFEMSPQAFLGFSHTRALSPRGRADVFDEGADGIVISEGGAVVVLKRLADATRDGDRIYAVIKAVAASSDGRGLSMTAPRPEGQRLALERAYDASGVDPGSLRLYEAHGTGTRLGDTTEAETIGRWLEAAGCPPAACAIGSAKSLVGHTRTAAGLVALVKTTLALHHQVLPPHAGVTRPIAAVAADGQPLALLEAPRPWLAEPGLPRRAGVSAFGFGGTNYHAVLEEHRADVAEMDAPLGAAGWPAELFVLAAPDEAALGAAMDRLDRAAALLESWPADGSAPPPFTLRDLAATCAVQAREGGGHRLALVAATAAGLRERLRA
ncbi:MAG: beta-ketoacyl synthase N-terminal-like domain-containing protein, partial [Vicinamibacterales bacterium]|nr:beta-ketoacyl synthase N-terminal-like domain-containing protein [Vicinamibacterales bacterium]